MRFVDANVFIHAFIKPKRTSKPHEAEIKEAAKNIVQRINRGKRVCTGVVQLVEITNLLEEYILWRGHLRSKAFFWRLRM